MSVEQMDGGDGNFCVAARGWRHPAWKESFYPEGLPVDWQLSYYSNEFRAVVVPAEEWAKADAREVARWQKDTGKAFRFFFEVVDLRNNWMDFQAVVALLAGQIGGILLRPTHCDSDLTQLELSLQRARQLAPVTVILPPGLMLSDAGQHRLLDYGVVPPWSAGQGTPCWRPGLLALARADATVRTPRQWREVVEDCLSFGAGNGAILLMMEGMMAGEAPDIEALRMTMTIADMLSVAEVLR